MIVDARGHRCPTPSLKLQKAMREARPGARITLLATDPMARIDVPHLLAETGGALVSVEETDGLLTIVVETPGAPRG
ncbi:MAG TPA: sulfurtransferase TusA family protein [Brevundimonas sp.]|jgi:tRNA 2-thiouridine synthesizing protein A|uniref:sulfurtransferase TusA family protein n=1 Tax=Brevundimonas sp. TaxID=1871086 RepID=UPI002EDA4086